MTKPAGRGILFDFDDTLVETTVFFEIARERYARLMAGMGFPRGEVLAVLDQKDIENVRRCGGFLKECFPRAMAETYRHFCGLNGIDPDPDTCRQVEDIGWWVFDQKPVVVPGAGEILGELSARREYDLFLATKGDPSVQWRRINDSGLKKYFKKVYVLKDKTSRQFELIARWQKLDARHSWVVGNSIKSDINPGLLAGFNCIFIPHNYTWHYEMEEPLGEFATVGTLEEVLNLLLNKKAAV
ncbi:MAG: HAD hydrolase-like protein [Peptococcaceae bacterium]|nr:HAD hydrolase-like protein [Peptococcaceae bacterium]